jgi:hypothetical protein
MNLWLIVAFVAMAIVAAVVAMATRGHVATDKPQVKESVATDTATVMDDKARRLAVTVAVLAGVATVLLTVAAFVLSYAHLEGVAVRNGVPAGFHAWVWPGTIDTFIIIGELLIFLAAIAHLGFSWWGWGLTIGGSAASIAFNVLGVGADAPPMQYAVAAAPPVAALFAFGALMHQVRRYVSMATPRVSVATDTDMAAAVTALMATPPATPVMAMATTPETVAMVTAIPPRPTVAPVAMATDDVATPRVSVAKRVAGVATDMATAMDKALVATDTMTMTALMGRPYTPTVATATPAVKRVATAKRKRKQPVIVDTAMAMATITDMIADDPDTNGFDVATRFGISDRTGRRLLAMAKGSAS